MASVPAVTCTVPALVNVAPDGMVIVAPDALTVRVPPAATLYAPLPLRVTAWSTSRVPAPPALISPLFVVAAWRISVPDSTSVSPPLVNAIPELIVLVPVPPVFWKTPLLVNDGLPLAPLSRTNDRSPVRLSVPPDPTTRAPPPAP